MPEQRSPRQTNRHRWGQLALGFVCMMLIANLQYSWTLFVKPMSQARGWTFTEVQWAFSIFIAVETWFTPIAGWLVDKAGPRVGPRAAVIAGGIAVAVGWAGLNGQATALWQLYLAAIISGAGAGSIYATCVGTAVRWFPDRRGLAVGIIAGGFGGGAALTVVPISIVIEHYGYAAAFVWFGLLQGGLLCVAGSLLRAPDRQDAALPRVAVQPSAIEATPRQMLSSPVFWLLYAMFVLISASGLMATAQLALIASDLHVATAVILFGAPALSVALVVDNVMNGAARPLFGWISDRIGREATMAIAFGCGGLSYVLLAGFGRTPWLFVTFAALIFLTWGEIFSLFPATCTDSFGTRYASVNAGLLYTAKGVSALLVPFANVIKEATGGWLAVFVASAGANLLVVLLALFVLRPLRARSHAAIPPLTVPGE